MSYRISHSFLKLNNGIPWHFAITTWANANDIIIKENITEEYYEFENFSDCAYLKLVWDKEFAEKWYTEYIINRLDTGADPRQLLIPFK
jgi:hypothetical protein|tara:strand:+ start:3352 stop:3618 length:267 start_codon:yes stop_codon:yes gene_type:complete